MRSVGLLMAISAGLPGVCALAVSEAVKIIRVMGIA
jgi:hypothetical protein